MSWRTIIAETAKRAAVSQADVNRVLTVFSQVVAEQVIAGEAVRIPGVGSISTAWRGPRSVRSITDMRKIVHDGRYIVRFRPAGPLRDGVAARTPQRWRDPRHQAAWRVAETVLGDLALYHASKTPSSIPPDAVQARAILEASFGDAWVQALRTFEGKVDPAIRSEVDHLLEAAMVRWA